MIRVGAKQCVRTLWPALWGVLMAAFSVAPAWAQGSPAASTGSKPEAGQAASTTTGAGAAETPPDKVIMKVGNQQITAEEFEGVVSTLNPTAQRSLAAQGYKPLGDSYAMFLALSQQAKAQGLDQSPEFKKWLEMQQLQWLAQNEYKKISEDIKITPDDINQYYQHNRDKFEQVEIRQVSVRKKPAGAKADAPGLPGPDARKRAEDIRQALASGQDAGKVAEQYQLANAVFFDPNPRAVRHGQLPGEMDKAAWSLKDGQVSDIQDNPMNFYFIQVVKHNEPTVQAVSKEIESKIREEKFKQAMDNLREQAKIWLDPEFFSPPKPPATSEAPKPSANAGVEAKGQAPSSATKPL